MLLAEFLKGARPRPEGEGPIGSCAKTSRVDGHRPAASGLGDAVAPRLRWVFCHLARRRRGDGASTQVTGWHGERRARGVLRSWTWRWRGCCPCPHRPGATDPPAADPPSPVPLLVVPPHGIISARRGSRAFPPAPGATNEDAASFTGFELIGSVHGPRVRAVRDVISVLLGRRGRGKRAGRH